MIFPMQKWLPWPGNSAFLAIDFDTDWKAVLQKKGQTNTNTKLSAAEEKALCLYIDRLDNINLAVRAEFVTDAANHILQERGKDSPVGQNWTTRFLKRHGYHRRLQKKLNADRQASEDVDRVAQYFQSFNKSSSNKVFLLTIYGTWTRLGSVLGLVKTN